MLKKILTTGQLRQVLADSLSGLLANEIDVATASGVYKIAQKINDSLYTEIRVQMAKRELGAAIEEFGRLRIGE